MKQRVEKPSTTIIAGVGDNETFPAEREESKVDWRVKDILVPTDFSAASRNALKYALNLARQYEAKIKLLYVIEPPIYTDFQAGPAVYNERETSERARAELEQLRDEQGADAGYIADIRVVIGKPYAEITAVARGLQPDVIVIATHGRTGIKHVLLGSTAEKVVRHASCPVLVVRASEDKQTIGYQNWEE